jgi:hypothetical protein
MNIRIQNFPPGICVDELAAFLGASNDIEHTESNDDGNADNVVAIVRINTVIRAQQQWQNLSTASFPRKDDFWPRH